MVCAERARRAGIPAFEDADRALVSALRSLAARHLDFARVADALGSDHDARAHRETWRWCDIAARRIQTLAKVTP